MAKYRQGPVPYTGDIQQLERFLNREFQELEQSTDDIYTLANILLTLYQVAGYGQIGLDAVTPLANIGGTYQQLPFDVELINDPRFVLYNLAGDGMLPTEAGVWYFFAKVSLEFTETNQGRRLELSLWNTADNVAIGPTFNFSIGRNTDGANLNFSIMFEISEQDIADGYPIGLAVRSTTDSFTGVQAIGSIFGIANQAQYSGDLFENQREIIGA